MATARAQAKQSASPAGTTATTKATRSAATAAAKNTDAQRVVNKANGAANAMKSARKVTETPRAKRGSADPAVAADTAASAAVRPDAEGTRRTRADAKPAVPVQPDRSTSAIEHEALRPAYWDSACADLVKRDRILKKLIPKLGPVHLRGNGDPFVTLARSIVGQQISVAAAQSIWRRVEDTCAKLVPQQFLKLGHETLMTCGLSKRKAEYILDLAQHFASGSLHVGRWTSMDDEDVIAELTQIRGIGRWTAEMFLIFNLYRPNVLPLDDLGLIQAISVNYFSGEPVTRSEAREVAANWEPWRTVATWYMWRSLEALRS